MMFCDPACEGKRKERRERGKEEGKRIVVCWEQL